MKKITIETKPSGKARIIKNGIAISGWFKSEEKAREEIGKMVLKNTL